MDLVQLAGYFLQIILTGGETAFKQVYSLLGLAGVVGFFVGYFLSDKMQAIKTYLMIGAVIVLVYIIYIGYTETQALSAAANMISPTITPILDNSTTFIPYP
jgi:intracellular septation protein A